MMKVKSAGINFEQQPLSSQIGFKGGQNDVIWTTSVFLEGENGTRGYGVGTLGILWSDQRIFFDNSHVVGSSMMFLMTAYALKIMQGRSFDNPIELMDELFPKVYEYATLVTGLPDLRKTFVLNSLVSIDNAAWQLYYNTNKLNSFDDIIPSFAQPLLEYRNSKLSVIPMVSYGVSTEDLEGFITQGIPILKIKIGSDPENDGDPIKMLEWDKKRLEQIHELAKNVRTKYTDSGNILYYLDANGRYDSVDRVKSLLEFADKIGALERIVILEEPFAEGSQYDVSELPVCVAADESAHCVEDINKLSALGYSAIALKPIAKTLSMSFKMLEAARFHKMLPFCADLTVVPVMVEWNKNFAARLAPLPGLKIGAFETNGSQFYKNWDQMKEYHPCFGKSWIEPVEGIFYLEDGFYEGSGGIFKRSEHYASLAEKYIIKKN